MARSRSQIEDDIRALSVPDKEALLRMLWAELDGSDDRDVESTWLREAIHRDREIDDGVVDTLPAEEVFKELEAKLGR